MDKFSFISAHLGYPLLASLGLAAIFDFEGEKGFIMGCEAGFNGKKCKFGYADFTGNDGFTLALSQMTLWDEIGNFNRDKPYLGLEIQALFFRLGFYYPPKNHIGSRYYLINFDYGISF